MVVEDVVVEVLGVVPNLVGAIAAVIPQLFAMALPVFAILIAPVLAVLASAIEIVPTLILVLLEVIARLLAILRALIPRLAARIDALLPLLIAILRALGPIRPLFWTAGPFTARSRAIPGARPVSNSPTITCGQLRRTVGESITSSDPTRYAPCHPEEVPHITGTRALTRPVARARSIGDAAAGSVGTAWQL